MSDLLWTKPRVVGGVLLRPPTVRSFFRALEKFGPEIGAIRQARAQLTTPLSFDVGLSPFIAAVGESRVDYVLEDVLPPWQGEGYRPSSDLPAAIRALAEVLGKDLLRLDELLGDPGVDITEETAAGDDVLYVLGCAERFKIDPRAVLDWPLGLFLDVIQVGVRSAEAREALESKPYIPTETFLGSMMIPTIQADPVGDPDTAPIIVEARDGE